MNSQSQSSSTLNNYVPQETHEKHTDSSCSQCQHINIQNKKSSQSSQNQQEESSSHDNGDLVGPLHNHIVAHTRQLQKTLELLQFQVQKLKQSNKAKDRMIDQLKIQIKKYSATHLQDNIKRQSLQIKNLRRQLQSQNSIPSSSNFGSNRNFNHSHLHSNEKNQINKFSTKNIQVIYQQKNNPKTKQIIANQNQNDSDLQEDSLLVLKEYKQKGVNKKAPKEVSKSTQKILKNAYENQHKQKQKIFIEKQNSYLQNIERLQKHIKIYEEEMVWMTNFILGFLKMGQKLSFYFNEKIIYNNWTLRKKTKTVWRYIKQLLYHFMQMERQNT